MCCWICSSFAVCYYANNLSTSPQLWSCFLCQLCGPVLLYSYSSVGNLVDDPLGRSLVDVFAILFHAVLGAVLLLCAHSAFVSQRRMREFYTDDTALCLYRNKCIH